MKCGRRRGRREEEEAGEGEIGMEREGEGWGRRIAKWRKEESGVVDGAMTYLTDPPPPKKRSAKVRCCTETCGVLRRVKSGT